MIGLGWARTYNLASGAVEILTFCGTVCTRTNNRVREDRVDYYLGRTH